ncbi:MAG: dihydrofolate reductase [Deltaproteobacteria bacterium]|nr:dihydrofolate reductase [Deltaproteobacteria bacterium]
MTTGHVYIATSLDGFVAWADHTLDWLNDFDTQGEDMGYDAFVETIDVTVMGRGSFQTVHGFGTDWPCKKPVVVMSRTLNEKDVPEAIKEHVRVSALSPADVMAELAQNGKKRAYIDGGRLVQSFVRAGLVEDFIVTTVPVFLGDGLRLFGPVDSDIHLELVDVKSFKCGMVQAHHKVRG